MKKVDKTKDKPDKLWLYDLGIIIIIIGGL